MADSIQTFVPGWRATDANDNPIPGAKLKYYNAGTTTPKVVYADADLTVSLGAVVTCDAEGYPTSDGSNRVLVYTGTAAYKIVCTTSADVTVWTHDNVRGASVTPVTATSTLPITPVVTKSANYTVVVGDRGKLINCLCSSGNITITLPSAITAGDNFRVGFQHVGTANAATILPVGGQTISQGDKATPTLVLLSYGETVWLVSDGANWRADTYVPRGLLGSIATFEVADRLPAAPASPAPGARYIISDTPTGVWATNGYTVGQVIQADGNGGWIAHTPKDGWTAYLKDETLLMQYRGTAWVDLSNIAAPTSSALKKIVVKHSGAASSTGGTQSAATWVTSTLSTVVENTITGASLASNKVTLPAGNYLAICVRQMAYVSSAAYGAGKLRLYNDTDSTEIAVGVSGGAIHTGTGFSVGTPTLVHPFTLSATKDIRLDFYATATAGVVTLGVAVGGADEIFCQLTILSLSSLQGPQGPQGIPGDAQVGPEYYDVDARHNLDGTTGDVAKIAAAIAACPLGGVLHFPAKTSLINAPITLDRQCDMQFHGTTWSAALTTSQDLLTIAIPGANTVSGEVRGLEVQGLRWFFTSGGRHGIVFKKGATGIGNLQNRFARLLGGNGSAAAGYAFVIQDLETHWNVLENSFFGTRGVYHQGADGWKFRNNGFYGERGLVLECISGAFETILEGNYASVSELAWWITQGQQYKFRSNSWEQVGTNGGAHDAQCLIYPQSGDTARVLIDGDNFGGGANVGYPLKILGNVYDTIIAAGTTSNPGASTYDVYIASSAVKGTQFRSTWARGTRSSVDETRPWSVLDSGVETQGIWKGASVLSLQNSWAAGTARFMVDPHTKELLAEGYLVPGTLTAGTTVGTLPAGMRPKNATRTLGMSNSGTTPVSIAITTAGVITLNSAATGTEQYVEQMFHFPVKARTSYDPVV